MLNDCISVHNRKPQKYAEIFKLAAELAERDVNFELKAVALSALKLKKVYLYYPDHYMKVATVAQGTGTKGNEDGLLEITGLLYREEAEKIGNGTLGWLTAENVLERILKKEAEKNG